ncbi:DUF3080 domain-containing protein [Marinobacter sp. NP-4(2019)]|uniref:DUF3080 domain-containing protein n=1 Tax=Marinobacter sp. NP-4(2019) TaxID=2488665 RepID=UPI003A523166
MILRHLMAISLTLVIAGCNPFSEAPSMMDEYVERVARVLDGEVSLSELPEIHLMPRRRDRRLDMPDLELGILDFLSLYGCQLQFVVGERNSVMGRVMDPLNRLRYELRFIEAARDCLPEIDRENLRESVEQAIDSKLESLPIAIWNATWATEEIETLFTLSKGYFPVAAEGNPVSDLSADINRLNSTVQALLEGRLDQSLEYVGEVHQRWQAEFRAGQLLNSAGLLIARLDDATAIIRSRLGERPLCLDGKPNSQSKIVQSMFFSVYIETVQPYMSDVRRAREELIRPLATLSEIQSEVRTESFRGWSSQYLASAGGNSLWQDLDRAMAEHTTSWQQLLEQCGLRPGS